MPKKEEESILVVLILLIYHKLNLLKIKLNLVVVVVHAGLRVGRLLQNLLMVMVVYMGAAVVAEPMVVVVGLLLQAVRGLFVLSGPEQLAHSHQLT